MRRRTIDLETANEIRKLYEVGEFITTEWGGYRRVRHTCMSLARLYRYGEGTINQVVNYRGAYARDKQITEEVLPMEITIKGEKAEQKIDVPETVAVREDTLRIGDKVKVLRKPTYGDMKIQPGVVIAFEPFKSLPTVVVAVVDIGYSDAKIEFIYFNANTKDVEMVKAIGDDLLTIDTTLVNKSITTQIVKLEQQIEDLKNKQAYFQEKFRAYFVPVETEVPVTA